VLPKTKSDLPVLPKKELTKASSLFSNPFQIENDLLNKQSLVKKPFHQLFLGKFKFKQKDAKSRDVLKAEIFKTALILMYRNCGYKPSNLIKTSIYGLFCKNSYRNISEFCCGFSCRINDDFQLIVWQVLLPKIHLQKQLEFGKYLSVFKPY
jgi:hypothetical protein